MSYNLPPFCSCSLFFIIGFRHLCDYTRLSVFEVRELTTPVAKTNKVPGVEIAMDIACAKQ